MPKNELIKKIVDDFLIKKEGKSVLKRIDKKNLISEGIIDSLDVFTLASKIEKKTKIKINIADSKIFKKFQKYKTLINL
ncbi:hypothetical protein [Candidatus Pelagibacter sp. HIMB1483]|uniref:hypothetical protein n=1 Tax=Candidatus Pelagibacter sp. HIMB1483 TaxID=3415414 RepID=UPI003F86F7EC